MNKILLLSLSLAVGVTAFAGGINANKNLTVKSKVMVNKPAAKTGFEGSSSFSGLSIPTSSSSSVSASASMAPAGDVVGETTYDLQTNRGVCRRIAIHPNSGNWHMGWTMDLQYTDNPGNERGTGYNFYDVTTENYQPYPLVKIEPLERTGWPNMGVTASGRIFSITHTSASGMNFCYKDDELPGTAWSETVVGSAVGDLDGVWARAAVDGDTIHAVISRQSSFNGAASGLNYIRSTDNGDTWTPMGGLEYDYSETFGTMEPDSYQIDARDGTVVVAYGGILSEIILYKSTDGGDNWNKSTILPTSNPKVEYLDNGFTVDPYLGTDGGITVVLDNTGMAHVVYSSYLLFNLDYNDFIGEGSFFRTGEASSLFYWNESKSEPEIIGESVMYDDGDGQLGNLFYDENYIGLTQTNTVAYPLLGIDQNNGLYLTYKSDVDGAFQADTTVVMTNTGPHTEVIGDEIRLFSDVFILKSTDAGESWDGPVNLTNSPATDDVFPSLPKHVDVDGIIPVIYQSDSLTGLLLRENQGTATLNEMAVVTIAPANITDANAPVADSEPFIIAIPFTEPLIVAKGCEFDQDLVFRPFLFAFDYPDGLVTQNIQLVGGVDYDSLGIVQTEALVAFDSNGNASDTLFIDIEVVDDVNPPEILTNLDCEEITVVAGSTWTTPEFEIFDDSFCDIEDVVFDPVDINTVGSYLMTVDAMDAAGNAATQIEITVNVIAADTEGPVITASDNVNDVINVGDGLPVYEFTSIDNVDCADATITVTDDINIDVPGTYTITVVALDAQGNETTEMYDIVVADLQAPLISLIGPATVNCINGVFDATVDPGVNATDLVSATADIVITADYSLVDCDVAGTYIVLYTATDEAGNTASATRQVVVTGDGTGINEYLQGLVDVYPNPTKGLINVELSTLVAEKVEIYNLIGELVDSKNEIATDNVVFDLTENAEGIYMIAITTNEGVVTKKVTLNK